MRQIRQRLLPDISQNAGIDIGRSYLVVEAIQHLEQLCKPGSVVVQGAVSERVPIRLPIAFGNLGERAPMAGHLAAFGRCYQYPQGIKVRCLLFGGSGAPANTP